MKPQTPPQEPPRPITLGYALLAVLAGLWLSELWSGWRAVEPMAYSEFQRQLAAGNVESLTVAPDAISGTLKAALPDGRKRFTTLRVDPALASELGKLDVKFSGAPTSSLLRDVLNWVMPVLVFVLAWYFLMGRLQQRGGFGAGLLSIGKSKAKVYVETDTKVTFADVAGVDEAKQELQEVVGFLKDPQRYGRLGARLPRGVLLVGPPGTGKTLLARAVAGEAGVPFLSINGSEFVEMFVGLGAARVRDLFDDARKRAPAIIFIDEIDALGRARGAYGLGGHDEKEQTLNQLLAELDGFDPRSGLVLLAATNRPEILDPALLRPGRFDRQVLVDKPDRVGRVQILQVHTRKITIARGLDLDQIAGLTPGFSGADLANLVNEAALQATRRERADVTLDDFTLAIERIVAGLEKRNRLLNPKERQVVAYHEMGHALVAMSLPGSDPVQKISIIPRGIGALGYTLQRPLEDRYLMARSELDNKMAVLLGGRAAEQLAFGELSTGAADDLTKVTEIALAIVARYGMEPSVGPLAYDSDRPAWLGAEPWLGAQAQRKYSEATAREIDVAARRIVEAAFVRSLDLLRQRKAQLDRGAKALLERETLTEPDLRALLDETSAAPVAPLAAG